MLYLFLTGKKAAYLNDVFMVLYLPESMTCELKYKDAETNSVVDTSANALSRLNDEDVLVLFNNEKHEYIPLRWGKCLESSKHEGQIYYQVKLGKYCHTVAERDISTSIDRISGGKIRNVGHEGSQGVLTVCCEDERKNEEIKRCIMEQSDSWIKTVKMLSKQERIKQWYAVFTKLEIIQDKKKAEQDKRENFLYSNEDYIFRFSYYVPEFNDRPMGFIPIDFGKSDKELGIAEKSDVIMSEQNRINIRSVPQLRMAAKNQSMQFGFTISENTINNKFVQYARTPVKFIVIDKMSKWIYYILLGLCIFGIAISTYVSTLDYKAVLNDPEGTVKAVLWLCSQLDKMGGIQNILCSALTGFLTWGMVKLVGKPKL